MGGRKEEKARKENRKGKREDNKVGRMGEGRDEDRQSERGSGRKSRMAMQQAQRPALLRFCLRPGSRKASCSLPRSLRFSQCLQD